MPTIKRRRRQQRSGLTENQLDVLVFGMNLFSRRAKGSKDFESQATARAAWGRHRTILMSDHTRPGKRPAGFYRFDLEIDAPNNWYQELRTLEERNLLTQEEAAAVEKIHPLLDPEQSPGLNASFEHPDRILEMELGHYMLSDMEKQFTFASEWHQRRGRPALAERYTCRASCLRVAIQFEVTTITDAKY
jgi:hypothetical protein